MDNVCGKMERQIKLRRREKDVKRKDGRHMSAVLSFSEN